ncbi:MAG: hypothetical protein HY323_05130 [Betaproteobacteria bacterium]|nr:hypothetical protein [Betaproteobacteria bacterium]
MSGAIAAMTNENGTDGSPHPAGAAPFPGSHLTLAARRTPPENAAAVLAGRAIQFSDNERLKSALLGALTLTDTVIAQEQRLASAAAGARTVERALDEALVVTGAELYGVMSRALEMSLDYMRTRVQFGRPIGSFQALQHRAVDLYIEQQLSSAVLEEALATLDGDPGDIARGAIASRVKLRCGDAALRITREAIQLHGAIGFTDEYDVGLYLKRALVLAAWLGNGAAHRRRYARLVPTDSE